MEMTNQLGLLLMQGGLSQRYYITFGAQIFKCDINCSHNITKNTGFILFLQCHFSYHKT